jgi:hypothetical protein
MQWGTLAIIIAAFTGPVLSALFLIWLCKVQTRREDRYGIHGDVIAVPHEARGGKSLGERAEKAARAQRRTGHIAHDKRASTR